MSDNSTSPLAFHLGPVSVAQLVATTLEGFLAIASIHLGEALPAGQKLKKRDPIEAGVALMGAKALLTDFSPLLGDSFKAPWLARLERLETRFAKLFGGGAKPAANGV
jgi:hypothetical protein